MMLLAATILVSAGAALAQNLAQVPRCAQPCLTEFVTTNAIAGCNAFDAKCICENENFLDEIACCLVDSCNAEQQADTVRFAHEICATVGVTNLPDEIVCRPGSGSSATPSDASASASSSVSASQSETESPSSTADAAGSEDTESPNAGPAATMAPVGILGGLIAAVAML